MSDVIFCEACAKSLSSADDYFMVKSRGDQPHYLRFFCDVRCITRYYGRTTFHWETTRDDG